MNVLTAQNAGPGAQTPEPVSVPTPAAPERCCRAIKSGDTFGVFDHGGDILAVPGGTDGLYHRDTRHLSRLELTLGGARPSLLSSALGMDDATLTSDLSDAPACDGGDASPEGGVIHVQRLVFLGDGACHGRLALRSFASACRRVRVQLNFGADFADLFEVRGASRIRRGERLPAALAGDGVTLSYRGLDGVVRATRLGFEPAPQALTAGSAAFDLELQPGGRAAIFFRHRVHAQAGPLPACGVPRRLRAGKAAPARQHRPYRRGVLDA